MFLSSLSPQIVGRLSKTSCTLGYNHESWHTYKTSPIDYFRYGPKSAAEEQLHTRFFTKIHSIIIWTAEEQLHNRLSQKNIILYLVLTGS